MHPLILLSLALLAALAAWAAGARAAAHAVQKPGAGATAPGGSATESGACNRAIPRRQRLPRRSGGFGAALPQKAVFALFCIIILYIAVYTARMILMFPGEPPMSINPNALYQRLYRLVTGAPPA
jgi:ferric-dicitrate binding protein FerR (iron transport regulator)